jgi:hypothetical protein
MFFAPLASAGELRGTVHLVTDVASPMQSSLDPYAGTLNSGGPGVSGAPRGVNPLDVVLYLEGPATRIQPRPSGGRPTLRQINQSFEPHVLGVPVGTTVDFPNGDLVYHNVFSYSKTKKFDLGYYGKGRSKTVTFDRPGVVQVFCDIHSTMSAYVLVVDTPFVTQPDEQGAYAFTDLPEGTTRSGVARSRRALDEGDGRGRRRRPDRRESVASRGRNPRTTVLRFGSLRMRVIVLTTIRADRDPRHDSAVRLPDRDPHGARARPGEPGRVGLGVRADADLAPQRAGEHGAGHRAGPASSPFSIPEAERGEEFRPTVEGVAADFVRITDADFMEIFDAHGALIARVSRGNGGAWTPSAKTHPGTPEASGRSGIEMAMKGSAVADFYEADDRIVAAAVAPVYVAHNLEAVIRLGLPRQRVRHRGQAAHGCGRVLARRAPASTFPSAFPGRPTRRVARARGASTIARGWTLSGLHAGTTTGST